MPSLELLIPFALATFLFAVIPGPAITYTAAQTLARGRAAGLMAALGLHVGGYVHVVAAALGLSAVFVHVPTLYLAIKIVGAVYLVWLGISIIRSRMNAAELPDVPTKTPKQAFLESIVVEVLNPKAAMFFIAFLPQFVDPAAALPVWSQFLVLGGIVLVAFSSMDLATVCLTTAVLTGLKRTDVAQRVARWIGGSTLIGLGAHLAVARD